MPHAAHLDLTRNPALAQLRWRARPGLDLDAVRAEFPLLARRVDGRPLVYLDSAATAQTPRAVIDAVTRFETRDRANVHRAVHGLAQRATVAYEAARARVAALLGAASPAEIVFVRGATEALNLVAASYARTVLRPGDEVLVTEMEHHANIVPWQLVAAQTGAVLRAAPIDDRGELILDELARLIGERTKIVAVAHVSNVLGTVNPLRRIAELAHAAGAVLVVDGAQAAPHLQIDVQRLGCDFYAFSGHKVYGPLGIGALYGRATLLAGMPPYQGGGEMIRTVTIERSTFADPPQRFEAGTPNISGAIGLAAALDYLEGLGRARVADHEQRLLEHATAALDGIPGLRRFGDAPRRSGVISFTMEGIHPHDLATILDAEGIATRAGHHCAQPLMRRLGVPATLRASFGVYNTTAEVDALAAGLQRARQLFGARREA